MRQLAISFFVLLFCANTFAIDSFPIGTFAGEGKWKANDGSSGTYKGTLTFTATGYLQTNEFKNADGTTSSESNGGAYQFTENGFFTLLSSENKTAKGHCGTAWCHYRIEAKGGQLEETVAFLDDNVYKLGSWEIARTDGVPLLISWEEMLMKQ